MFLVQFELTIGKDTVADEMLVPAKTDKSAIANFQAIVNEKTPALIVMPKKAGEPRILFPIAQVGTRIRVTGCAKSKA